MMSLERVKDRLRNRMPGRFYARLGSGYRALRNLVLRWPSLPVVRTLRCLQFRRMEPLSQGKQRGTAIVRYYWAHYLAKHQADVRGRALEIGTTSTIRRYGGDKLTQAEAMDLEAHHPDVTVVADLSRADALPPDGYDCFINQFTMHVIYDVRAALYHSIRLLKPGGVLLVNFLFVDFYLHKGLDMGTGGVMYIHQWFTPIQVENLLRRCGLSGEDYTLETYGNLFSRVAYQMNVPAEQLTRRELDTVDPAHPILLCVRVVKPARWHAVKPDYIDPWLPNEPPARWNPVTGHYA